MTNDDEPIGANLTSREREVLAMVAAGKTNREIGAALFISESTAGVHVSNLMAKLGATSRTEAAAVAYRAGLVESAAGGPAPETSAGEPPPDGWWGRLSRAFQQQVESHPRRVAAAGVGGLAFLSFITVGLAVAVLGEAPVAGEADPTGSPRPSANATPTPRPTVSPTPVPIGGADVELEVDGLARVLADDLTLRTNPGTEAPRIGYVPHGQLGFVLAGPTIEDGYAWYQLAAVDPFGAGCASPQPPESLACRDWLGWVAAGEDDGEAWLAPHESDCPASGDFAGLAALRPLEALSCFGSTSMTLRVYRVANEHGVDCGPTYTDPTWLWPCNAVRLDRTESLFPSGEGLSVHVTPSLGSCDMRGDGSTCPFAQLEGRWLEIVAHYDDAQARSCAAVAGVPAPAPEAIVLQCRSALVASAVRADDGLGVLDQRQEVWVPESSLLYQPHLVSDISARSAQTFTAGRTGELTAIQLPLNRPAGTSGALVVEIRRGDPDGELLATSPAMNLTDLPTDTCAPPQCLALNREFAWVTIRFAQPADLIAGQVYAIVLPPGPITGSPNPAFRLAIWGGVADLYAGGVVWSAPPTGEFTWTIYSYSGDLAFRTIVR